MSQTISGWSPPLIYDLSLDERRLATQADVDRLVAAEEAYAHLRKFIKDWATENQRLTDIVTALPEPAPQPDPAVVAQRARDAAAAQTAADNARRASSVAANAKLTPEPQQSADLNPLSQRQPSVQRTDHKGAAY